MDERYRRLARLREWVDSVMVSVRKLGALVDDILSDVKKGQGRNSDQWDIDHPDDTWLVCSRKLDHAGSTCWRVLAQKSIVADLTGPTETCSKAPFQKDPESTLTSGKQMSCLPE